ncbi:MAG: hypothetical protein A2293_04750 [Elusimicrobia bacterium RIFOXYB2_FULL_49_7]|nr:MAG: hypothetical protein A2293_04750 [Elusimicrobia bacterium RIFOXYB2_FULL_49_7]
MSIKACIFDFDGTLVDTLPGIVRAWDLTFQALKIGRADPDKIKAAIGPAREVYVKMVLGEHAETHGPSALKLYKEFYKQVSPALTFMYDGISDLLCELEMKEIALAIASNKPYFQITPLAEKFGIIPFFQVILGPEKRWAGKPEPDMFLECAKRFNLLPEEILVIGDSELDLLAGQKAGMKRAAALWGYSSKEKLLPYEPDQWLAHPSALTLS